MDVFLPDDNATVRAGVRTLIEGHPDLLLLGAAAVPALQDASGTDPCGALFKGKPHE